MKKTVSYKIEEKLVNDFNITCHLNGDKMSDIVQGLIRDYVIKNKANINEYMRAFWNDEINDDNRYE